MYGFLLDENVPRSVYRVLKELGYHVEYVPQGADDDTVFALAKKKGLVLVTRDSDFADELRYPPKTHHGIIVLKVHPPLPGLIVERLVAVIEEIKDFKGKLVIVFNDEVEVIE